MKIKDIRAMDKGSLEGKLSELKKELIKINAQVAIGTTPKNPGQVKTMKKTIAKILTVIKEGVTVQETKKMDATNKKNVLSVKKKEDEKKV